MLVEPLTSALKGKDKKGKITWSPEMEKALAKLKRKLTGNPI